MIFLRMFSRKWFLTTLLVIAAAAVMVRLGIWQLDRLEQRKAFNARVLAQIDQPTLDLTGEALQADLHNMEYRKVVVTGEYDPSQEIAITNQAMDGNWGVYLITPLKIAGTGKSVLVNRGWIPAEDYQSGDWSKYDEPGQVTVEGVIRRSQSRPDYGPRRDPTPVPGGKPVKSWNFVNVAALDQQIDLSLLPVYIQQSPDPKWTGYPKRAQVEVEITEGPHLGYAIQWFFFASLLVFGYPFYIKKQEARPVKEADRKESTRDHAGAHR